MSIVLAAVSPQRALLAVDTLGGELVSPAEVSNLIVIPQLGAALAVSGNVYLAAWVYGLILEVGRDFDAVASAILQDGLVDRAERGLLERLAEHDQAAARSQRDQQQLVALVGFSAERGRMCCIAAQRADTDAFRVFECGWLVSPPIETPLAPPPIKLGKFAAAYPYSELAALNAARIAGKSESEIRALVKRLVAARARAFDRFEAA